MFLKVQREVSKPTFRVLLYLKYVRGLTESFFVPVRLLRDYYYCYCYCCACKRY